MKMENVGNILTLYRLASKKYIRRTNGYSRSLITFSSNHIRLRLYINKNRDIAIESLH